MGATAVKPTRLSGAVVAWRAFHGSIALGFLFSIAYVWWCALTGRRGRLLRHVIAALLGEGLVVAANHGDCPLGPLGDRIGDPVPLFEVVLTPRAARRAIPTLGVLTAVGLALLAARSSPQEFRGSARMPRHARRPILAGNERGSKSMSESTSSSR